MSHRRALVLGALVASLCLPSTALGALDEVNSKKLRDGVTVNGILQHERALQAVANANGGTRASGTPGYEASLQYVKQRLVKAGYKVSEQEFTFPFFRELAPALVSQVTPTPKDYETETFEYSGSGDVTAKLQSVRGNTVPPTAPPGDDARGLHRRRLRRLHTRQHRADPARHMQLRRQGREREGGRRHCGDHLQRGPGGPHRPDGRHAR